MLYTSHYFPPVKKKGKWCDAEEYREDILSDDYGPHRWVLFACPEYIILTDTAPKKRFNAKMNRIQMRIHTIKAALRALAFPCCPSMKLHFTRAEM